MLDEGGGAAGVVNVRLSEAGNRSRPIAEKDFTIAPNQQLKLDTVFGNLGLDSADRRKDRTNVEMVVTATAGNARVAASAVGSQPLGWAAIDVRKGTRVRVEVRLLGSGKIARKNRTEGEREVHRRRLAASPVGMVGDEGRWGDGLPIPGHGEGGGWPEWTREARV